MRFSGFGGAVPGQSSREVLNAQGALIKLGYTLTPNGSYDASTSAAVLDFKEKMNYPLVDAIDADFATAIGMAGRPEYVGRFGGGMSTGVEVALGLLGVAVFYGVWAMD
jgi:peptidoglycan hydrolase-like protein with peptidoglycan-binding domain